MKIDFFHNEFETSEGVLILDKYDEDWTRLAGVLVRGHADIL